MKIYDSHTGQTGIALPDCSLRQFDRTVHCQTDVNSYNSVAQRNGTHAGTPPHPNHACRGMAIWRCYRARTCRESANIAERRRFRFSGSFYRARTCREPAHSE